MAIVSRFIAAYFVCESAYSVTRTPWAVVVRFAIPGNPDPMSIPVTQPTATDSKFAREAWVRALERTAGIDRAQAPTLPGADRSSGTAVRRGSRADIGRSDLELSSSLPARSQPIRALGIVARDLRRRRHRLPDDGELRGVHGDLARASREPASAVALINSQLSGEAPGPLHQHRRAEALIVGGDLAPRVAAVRAALGHGSCRAGFMDTAPRIFAPLAQGTRAVSRATIG